MPLTSADLRPESRVEPVEPARNFAVTVIGHGPQAVLFETPDEALQYAREHLFALGTVLIGPVEQR